MFPPWDLTFRMYMLFNKYITLRSNRPLADNLGFDQYRRNHRFKTYLFDKRVKQSYEVNNNKLSLLNLNITALDSFQLWKPHYKVIKH